MGKGLPEDKFALGLPAFAGFAIWLFLSGNPCTGIGKEDQTDCDHQDPDKQPYG